MAALRAAVNALENTPDESPNLLPGRLKDIARKGKRASFQFNHLGIRYQVKDKEGNVCPRWLVSNAITGRQTTYNTKDFMSKTGKVLWRYLAAAVNHT